MGKECDRGIILKSNTNGLLLTSYFFMDDTILNCWEFHQCGKEKCDCPAFPNGGRHCAALAGTFGSGQPLFNFDDNYSRCKECRFYKSRHYAEEFDKDVSDIIF